MKLTNLSVLKKKVVKSFNIFFFKVKIFLKKTWIFCKKHRIKIYIFLTVVHFVYTIYALFSVKSVAAFENPFFRDFFEPLRKSYSTDEIELASILLNEMQRKNKKNSSLIALSFSKTFINVFSKALDSVV